MKKAMRVLCPNCGGSTEILADGQYKCNYCDTVFKYVEQEDKQSGEQAELLLNASVLRQTLRFDEAADYYRTAIKKFPDDLRAYWGAFLSEYGVEYVKDDAGKSYPICHRISRLSALESRDLRNLFSHCSPAEHERYLCQAEEIERIRQQTYDISRAQQPYDVYVCHGSSGSDTDKARALEQALAQKGLRVFLPSRDIPERTHSQEAYIFAALESAKTMFVVATSIESVQKTDNTWRRFISDKSKKFQVVHSGLNEQDFPADLRRMLQRQEPISLLDGDWLKKAVEFAGDKSKQKESTPTVDPNFIQQLIKSAELSGRPSATASNLSEAFAIVLSCLTGGNVYDAERAINEQLDSFDPKELRLVAELCLELAKLGRVSEGERRAVTNNIGLIATRLRSTYPTLTLTERNVYSSIRNPKFLVYLAKCFGVPKDTARQCFVLDLIDCSQLNDTQLINELVGMLLKNNRGEDIKNVLRAVPAMDGNYMLLAMLNNYKGEDKGMLLLDIADKIKCSDAVEEEINYTLATCDDLAVALAVVNILTRNRIGLSAMALNGALSHVDARGMRTVLQNIGGRALSGVEVDKLISIAAEGGDETANEVLSYLWGVAHIEDIGSHNMRLLISKCNLANIKSRLFSFHIDKKLAEQLLTETLRSSSPDRLSNVKVLLEYVPSVDIASYERILTSDDPSKDALLELLAPKTGKFASANVVFERFLRSPADGEEKRKIISLYGDDFPFSDSVTELYLNIVPDEYNDAYIAKLRAFLATNPAKAREIFVKHYEALAVGYQKALPVILNNIRSMQNDGIVRFVCDFKGDQELKDKMFTHLFGFADKPKNIEVTLRDVKCNLAQAYLLTLRAVPPTTEGVVKLLRKAGIKSDEKVIYCGKKVKFAEYLGMGNVPMDVRDNALKFID